METQVPEDLTTVEDLAALEAELVAEFDEKYEAGGSLDDLEAIAQALDAVRSEQTARAEQEAKDTEKRQALLDRAHPQATDDADDESDDTEADAEADDLDLANAEIVDLTDEADDTTDTESAAADDHEKEPVMASGQKRRKAPSAAGVRKQGGTPDAPKGGTDLVITAAADVPGYSNGQSLDKTGIAIAMHKRARGMGDSRGARTPYGVATIHRPIPEHLVIGEGTADVDSVLTAAVQEHLAGKNAEALLASGGFCAPAETIYDFFSVESRDGLIDLPTIGVTRGSIQWPQYIGLDAAAGALWTWTEANDAGGEQAVTDIDIAGGTATATVTGHGYSTGQSVNISGTGVANLDGTYVITVTDANTFTFTTTAADSLNNTGVAQVIKQCLQVSCPGFDTVTLEAEGLCVTVGNLTDRAYPELTRRIVDLAVTAHLHRLSNAKLAKVLATATTVTVPTAPSDAAGDILHAIDLQVADYRSEHLMSDNTVLEALMPSWWTEAIRSTLAMRAGIDKLNVSDAEVNGYFTSRNLRPQYLVGYDALYRGATPATAFPATSKFTLFPAGGYIDASGGTIDLGVVRDSVLNSTNDHTAAWSEEFYSVMQRGPAAREVTVTTDVDGQTGGPEFLGV